MRTLVAAIVVAAISTFGGSAGLRRVRDQKSTARWDVQQSGVTDDLLSVCFVDDQLGFASGRENTIMRTTDGGRSWQRLLERDDHGSQFNQVIFTGRNEGWVASRGTLIHTTDSGESWNAAVKLPKSLDFGFGSGWAIGSTWFTLEVPGTGTGVWRSDDGCRSWRLMGSLPRNHYENICFVDQQHGWVAGNFSQSSIGFTSDGGKTWGFVDQSVNNRNNEVKFANWTTGWTPGDSGTTMLATTDGGRTWNPQFTGQPGYKPIEGISVVSDREVFAATDEVVIHTSDGGKTWRSIGKFQAPVVAAISFPDPSHGWVVGSKGFISHYHLVQEPERGRD